MDLEREWWGMREWERKTGYVCERERVIEGERSREREIVDSEMISYLSVGWWPCIGFCTRIFPFGWLSISMSAYMYVLVSVSLCLHSNGCVCVCVCVCVWVSVLMIMLINWYLSITEVKEFSKQKILSSSLFCHVFLCICWYSPSHPNYISYNLSEYWLM